MSDTVGTKTDTAGPGTSVVEADEFATLLKQSFKPRSDRAATEVDNAVATLVKQALADSTVIKADVLDTIEGMIAPTGRKAERPAQRDHPCRRVSEDRERLARPELPYL